jgi:hypothetical protein
MEANTMHKGLIEVRFEVEEGESPEDAIKGVAEAIAAQVDSVSYAEPVTTVSKIHVPA